MIYEQIFGSSLVKFLVKKVHFHLPGLSCQIKLKKSPEFALNKILLNFRVFLTFLPSAPSLKMEIF